MKITTSKQVNKQIIIIIKKNATTERNVVFLVFTLKKTDKGITKKACLKLIRKRTDEILLLES